MRFLFGLALILLLSASVAKAPDRDSSVSFRPIPLDRDHPGQRDFGNLTFLGAWKLTSDNPSFGGISSMRVRGGKIMALSDAAYVFQFDFDGHQSQSPLRARPLPGIYVNDSPDRDSESMTTDLKTGEVWVGFETSNAIRRYAPDLEAKQAWVAPPAMRYWPENQGPEAMVRLADGRFIVFSEASPGPDHSAEALVFAGDPILQSEAVTRFYYRPPPGFSPTDAAQLPDGRVLVLNRHFSIFDGVAAALVIIDPRDIAADKIVREEAVARLAPPLTVDNMEALSIEEDHGITIIWIASDDNFNPLQQTLLMKFALKPARTP